MPKPALSRASELALARRFAAMTPGLFLFLAAFAYGNSAWSAHPIALVTFAGLFAASSFWQTMLVGAMAHRYDEAPDEWSARFRRSVYFSATAWSAFGCWAGIRYAESGYFLYFVLTATVAGAATAALSDDLQLAERTLAVLLAPVVAMEMVRGVMGIELHGFALAAMTVMALAFLMAIAQKQNAARQQHDAVGEEFLADVDRAIGREIRTPLLGISGMVGLVLDGTLTTEQREYLEIARDRLQTLLTRVNEMSGIPTAPPVESPTDGDGKVDAKAEEKRTTKSKVLA